MKLHREYIRKYKKSTIAILLSMVMTIALVSCLLIVTHTDNHIKSLQGQYIQGAWDISCKNFTKEQIKEISNDNKLQYVELHKCLYAGEGKEKQFFSIIAANENNILERTQILKGRMPENKNEIIAEAWCLENLGVKPEPNSEFTVKVTNSRNSKQKCKKITYKVVGIISDNPTNKLIGSILLYTQFYKDYEQAELALKYKSGVNIKKQGNKIKKRFQLKDKQINYNYAVVDNEYFQSQLSKTNLLMVILLLGISVVVITGVYRISLMNRSSQYGILKAIGMQKRQIRKLIFAELYEIYFISIPIGVALGLLVAYLISILTRDETMALVFWGKEYTLHLDIPIKEITICILGVGFIVGGIVGITSHMMNRKTNIDIIRGKHSLKNNEKFVFMTRLFDKSEKPYRAIALKYVFHDIKSTVFVVLSLSIGACLSIGLFYQSGIKRTMNSYEKQLCFYNGDYILEKFPDDLVTTGLSKDILLNIKKIKGVKEINTQRALPIRVIDDKKIVRNKSYFEFYKKGYLKGYPYDSFGGNDGTDEFYMTELKAYNNSALKNLHNYLLEGDYDPTHMDKDSVIIFMPKTIAKNDWRRPQNYPKSGYYIMNYKVGDKLTFKYRTDFKTNVEKYYHFTDKEAKYSYKNFKIAAIVYYPYMRRVSDMSRAYPTLIISENQMKKIVPEEKYATITLSVNKSLGNEYLNDVNDKLAHLVIKNHSATARSIIDQTRDMDNLYRKQLIYFYGLSFIVLLLAFINIINNLKYRIYIRKEEISIYRAIGIQHKMICKMIRLENMILGGISGVIICLASYPITLYLYKKSQISYFEIHYHNDTRILGAVFILILLICNIVSRVITKELCKSNIVENINSVE